MHRASWLGVVAEADYWGIGLTIRDASEYVQHGGHGRKEGAEKKRKYKRKCNSAGVDFFGVDFSTSCALLG